MSENDIDTVKLRSTDLHSVIHVGTMFENWFLDYASYVVLNRAIPEILDGLKPVQRRIFHSMFELENGGYKKVANIVGNTMKYHPHGDTSIGDALVQLGQKKLTIDTQGNWGNILTGDNAAAPRYIEARLSKFALEVIFNPKTTDWQFSYDGQNKEPVALPVKFPLLLAHGTQGIAVGLSTYILPHNFNELIDASIAILEKKTFDIYPDFPQGGYIDVERYNDGKRGGKIRNRAKINILDKKTLVITEIPFGVTTTDLIDNIAQEIEKNNLKIRKIDDNTSSVAEIILHLQAGVSPDQTIEALFAFTKCEMQYSPNACVIHNNKPAFLSVKDILFVNTENTVALLKKELEIQLEELEELWHKISLEKIFFEKRIYKELEKDTDTWEIQISNIETAFDPYRTILKKEITKDDILKLCEKPVRKISKFDIKKADDQLLDIDTNIEEVKNHLEHIIEFSINYFRQLKKKYGKDKERKTEIKKFDNIDAAAVAIANCKLFIDRKEGFAGTNLKKTDDVEYVCECSNLDEIIVFNEAGKFIVSKVSEKQYFGKNIYFVDVFKRNDDRTIYNMVYSDGLNGKAMIKRFAVGGVTRDKEYDLTKGTDGSKILYLTSNPNGEAEKIKVYMKAKPKLKKLDFEFDFSSIAIKGRSSMGNILSKNQVRKIEQKEKGISTLGAKEIFFDFSVMKLNDKYRGTLLGKFKNDDKIISIYKSGYFRITGYDDLSLQFGDDLEIIKKYRDSQILTVVYRNKKEAKYFVKRFKIELNIKKTDFLTVDKNTEILSLSIDTLPQLQVSYKNSSKEIKSDIINVNEYVEIMNIRAKGKRIAIEDIKEIAFIEPLQVALNNASDEVIEADSASLLVSSENNNNSDEEVLKNKAEVAKTLFENIDKSDTQKKDSDGKDYRWEQGTLF